MVQTFSVFAKGWCQAPAFLIRVVVTSLTTTHWPLPAANLTNYSETVAFPEPEELKMSRAHRVKVEGKTVSRGEYLTLQPNPASDYVVASYRVTAGHSASLVLSDATGRQIESISIKPETNQRVISFARFTGGHYLITLVIDGKNVETGVISVVK